jgi:hypothetical protein
MRKRQVAARAELPEAQAMLADYGQMSCGRLVIRLVVVQSDESDMDEQGPRSTCSDSD